MPDQQHSNPQPAPRPTEPPAPPLPSPTPPNAPWKPLAIIATLIALAAIGLSAYLYYQKQQPLSENSPQNIISTPTSEALSLTPTIEPKLDLNQLETYTNPKLGFSIKLTRDLSVLNENDQGVEFATIPPMTQAYLTITYEITDFKNINICKPTTTTAPCIISNYWDKDEKEIEETIFTGMPASKFKVYRTIGRLETVIQTTQKPYIEARILSNYGFGDPEDFDQILSTFRFLDE